MSKAMFGIAGALALIVTPAWATDAKPEEKVGGDAIASRDGATTARGVTKRASKSASESGTRDLAQGGTGSGAMEASDAKRASHAERWLVEREGYRDGGY